MNVLHVDEASARAFLVRRLGYDVDRAEPVGEGNWSRAFGFVDGDRELVVRFGRHVDDFEKDRRASAFATPDLPVPATLDIGSAGDGWYAISERVRGEPLEELDADAWRAVLPSVLAGLGAVIATDIGSTTGFGVWDASGGAPFESWPAFFLAVIDDDPRSRVPHWRQALVDTGVGPTFERGVEVLASLVEATPPNVRSLGHADLINRNVLVADALVTGVFDWGCSLYGDPLWDAACLDFWAPWHPGLDAVGWRAAAMDHLAAVGVDLADADDRMRACQLHMGLDSLPYCVSIGRLDDAADVAARLGPLLD